MVVGVPREIKICEYRVGLSPASARELAGRGHEVVVQRGAGENIGFRDDDYEQAGARMADTAEEVFERSRLIVKVKEPQPEESALLKEDHILFTYLHLAPDPWQTKGLIDSGCSAVAYETVTDERGGLPLLAPMSEVAGRMSIQAGAHALEMSQGGKGVLPGGVPGVEPAVITIIGGGVAGLGAARMAAGLGAEVTVIDLSADRLRELDDIFKGRVKTVFSNTEALERFVTVSDIVVGAVLIPGASAPKLVTEDTVRKMEPGSVLVDISIDQGGCFETSRPTTHDKPLYTLHGVVHYCVTNMPGAVARTSTQALNAATLPYVLSLADQGIAALTQDRHFLDGLNIHRGKVTNKAVAEAQELPYHPAAEAVAGLN